MKQGGLCAEQVNRTGCVPLHVFDDVEFNLGEPVVAPPTADNGLIQPVEGLGIRYDGLGKGRWTPCLVWEYRPLEAKFTVEFRGLEGKHVSLSRLQVSRALFICIYKIRI